MCRTLLSVRVEPQEILKKISGFYGAHQSWVIIKSLTFHTNQGKIGPYGKLHPALLHGMSMAIKL